MTEEIKIIRKWFNRSKSLQFGQDNTGKLYCRDIKNNRNLVLLDSYHKVKERYYYKFIDPVTKKIKLVERVK